MLPICLLGIFLIGAVEGPWVPTTVTQVNKYFDTVLDTFRNNPEVHSEAELEMVLLPAFTGEFSQMVAFFGELKGQLSFSEGKTSKLTQPKRVTNCLPPYYSSAGRTFRCGLAFDYVKVDYATCKATYGNIKNVDFKTEATFSKMLFTVDVAENKPGKPMVRSVEITNGDKMYVKFTGLGPLYVFTGKIDGAFKTGMKKDPIQHVQGLLKNAFDHAVGWIPFPAE